MKKEMLKDLEETCFRLVPRALSTIGHSIANMDYESMITITSDTTARISLRATDNEWEAEFKFSTVTCLVELISIDF